MALLAFQAHYHLRCILEHAQLPPPPPHLGAVHCKSGSELTSLREASSALLNFIVWEASEDAWGSPAHSFGGGGAPVL